MEFYTENGVRLADELVMDASNILDSIMRKAEKYENKRVNDCSFSNYIVENFDYEINKKYKSDETKLILKGLCQWRCQYECGDNGCSNLDSLSVKYFGTFVELKGNQLVELKYGYKAIIDSMIRNVGGEEKFHSKIKLKHSLERVLLCEWLLGDCIECEHCLYTKDKNKIVLIVKNHVEDKNINFICNHVIFTMSLGYLKANFKNLFLNYENNEFFKEKYYAVGKLGFGNVNKVS
jgi:hypothetical protein